jgi:hypothetical protein
LQEHHPFASTTITTTSIASYQHHLACSYAGSGCDVLAGADGPSSFCFNDNHNNIACIITASFSLQEHHPFASTRITTTSIASYQHHLACSYAGSGCDVLAGADAPLSFCFNDNHNNIACIITTSFGLQEAVATFKQELTVHLMKSLPLLIRKHQADPVKSAELMELIPHLKLEVYALKRQEKVRYTSGTPCCRPHIVDPIL